MIKGIFLLLTIGIVLCGCIDLPTETQNNPGEELQIIITAKINAIYTIVPEGDVKFDKIATITTADTTEITTMLYLHRIKNDSISIIISKDKKRLLGRIKNSSNLIIKEFILDYGAETRVIKF